MGVPLIYLPTGVAFFFTAGIQPVTRNLDVFVWVVVRAGSPNISFFVGMPTRKNQQEILYDYFPKSIGQAKPPDEQEFLDNYFRENMQQIVWPGTQDPFEWGIAADGGTGMEVNHQ
jgi:hypothetical protein